VIATSEETTQAPESSLVAVSSLRTAALVSLFAAQAAAFALAAGSGKIPAVVLNLFRALLTL
jgi:hypothetical protein